ncbi:hypothetical protein ACFLXQ_01415 [Chloroflexota bacterium]
MSSFTTDDNRILKDLTEKFNRGQLSPAEEAQMDNLMWKYEQARSAAPGQQSQASAATPSPLPATSRPGPQPGNPAGSTQTQWNNLPYSQREPVPSWMQTDEYDHQRYEQYRNTVQRANQQITDPAQHIKPINIHQWQQMPEHRRLRMSQQRYVGEGQVPEGFIRRKTESFAYPTQTITQGSHLGVTPQGTMATFDEAKLLKRQQMLGAHQTVRLNAPGVSSPYAAPMRAGPMSQRADVMQRMNAAVIIGGDPGVAGQGFIQADAPGGQRSFIETSKTRTLWQDTPWTQQQLGRMAQPGQTFRPGQGYVLGEGYAAEKHGSKYAHGILGRTTDGITRLVEGPDGQPTRQYGLQYTIGQAAPTQTGLARMKNAFAKSELATADLSRWTNTSGQPLGVSAVMGMKDLGGYVYSSMMAQEPTRLANILGVKESQLAGMNYGSLGAAPLKAFEQHMLKDRMQTIVSPKGRRYQALVGPVAAQFSEDFPVREPRLSYDEMQALRRADPATAARLEASPRSQLIQRAYQGVVQAGMASTGKYVAPAGTITPSRSQAGQMLNLAQEQAREALGLAPNATITRSQALPFFRRNWEQHNQFWQVGKAVMAPGSSSTRFRATGLTSDTEVSSYVGRAYDMLQDYATNGKNFERSADNFIAAQMKIAGGGNAVRYATSVFPGRKDMVGTVLRGAPTPKTAGQHLSGQGTLDPHEAYVPGMGGKAIHMTGFPSQGDVPYEMALRSLTKDEVLRRGLDPQSLYAGQHVAQAMGRDYDGDLAYAIRASSGTTLSTPQQVKQYAQLALQRGAGDVTNRGEDIAGTRMSRATAMDSIRQQLNNPNVITGQQLDIRLAEQQQRYGAIGPYYNNLMRGLTTAPGGRAYKAMQGLFLTSHGITQRPAQLPAQLQDIQNLMGYNLGSGTFMDREALAGAANPLDAVRRISEGGAGSFAELRGAVTKSVVNAVDPKTGRHYFGYKDAANMLGFRGNIGATEQAIRAYRADPSAANLTALTGIGSSADWFTRTGMGRMVGGQAVRRAMAGSEHRAAISMGQIAGIEDIGMSAVQKMAGYGRQQQAAIDARSKRRDNGEADFLRSAEAAGEMMGMPMPAKKDLYDSPIGPIEGRRTAAPSAATATSEHTSYLPQGNDSIPRRSSRGGSQPPASPPPPAATGSGGGGYSGGGGFGPGRLSSQMIGDIRSLREGLSGVETNFGPGVQLDPRQHPEAHGVAQAAGRIYPNWQRNEGLAKAWVARGREYDRLGIHDNEIHTQREMGEDYLEQVRQIRENGEFPTLQKAYETNLSSGPMAQAQMRQRTAYAGQNLRLAQAQQKLGDIRARQTATMLGRRHGVSEIPADIMGQAQEVAMLNQQRYETWQGAQGAVQSYHQKPTGKLHDQLSETATSLKSLNEQIQALTPEVKEHIKTVKADVAATNERVRFSKQELGSLQAAYRNLEKSAVGASPERLAELQGQMKPMRQEIRRMEEGIQGDMARAARGQAQAGHLQGTIGGPAGRAITGMGRRPTTFGSRLRAGIGKEFALDRMNMQFQHAALGYYMLMAPTMKWRQQYIAEQTSVAGLSSALGEGISPEAIEAQQQAAAGSDFTAAMGKGAQSFYGPIMNRVAGIQRGNPEFAEKVGRYGSIAATTLVGGGAAFSMGKKILSPLAGALAGTGGISGLGSSLAANSAIAQGLGWGGGAVAAGGASAGAVIGTTIAAPLVGAGLTIGAYEGLRKTGAFDGTMYENASAGSTLRQWAATPTAMLGYGAQELGFNKRSVRNMREFTETVAGWDDAPSMGTHVSRSLAVIPGLQSMAARKLGFDNYADNKEAQTLRMLRLDGDRETSAHIETSIGPAKPVSATDTLIDVIKKASEVGGVARVDTDRAAQLGSALVTGGGYTADEVKSKGFQDMVSSIVQKSLDQMMAPEAVTNTIQQTVKATGYASGASQQKSFFNMLSGFQSQSDLANIQTAIGQTVGTEQRLGLQAGNLAGIYKRQFEATGDPFQAQRRISELTGGNQIDYSNLARAAGRPEMALTDELGRPVSQGQQWAIQDSMRIRNFARGQQKAIAQLDFRQQAAGLQQQSFAHQNWASDQQHGLSVRGQGLNIRSMQVSLEQMMRGIESQSSRLQASREHIETSYRLGSEMRDLNQGYQVERLDTGFARAGTQWAWQQEDFQKQSSRFETTSSWAIDDIDEAIRFSGGRQRRRLKRQRERMYEQQEWKRDDMATAEDRAETKWGWTQEDYGKQRDYMTQLHELQNEMAEENYQHQLKMLGLSEEDLKKNEESLEKQKEIMAERITLAEDQLAFTEENYERQKGLREANQEYQTAYTQWQLDTAERDIEHNAWTFGKQQEMIVLQRQQTIAGQLYAATMMQGYDYMLQRSQEIRDIHKEIVELTSPNQASDTLPQGSAGMEGTNSLLSLIYQSLSSSGGKIMIDADSLRENGFVHTDDFNSSYN